MSSGEVEKIKTSELPEGKRLRFPICDLENQVLLAAGVLLTDRIKDRLIVRGVTELLVHREDVVSSFWAGRAQARRR